jgi:hypothetical protein
MACPEEVRANDIKQLAAELANRITSKQSSDWFQTYKNP